MWWVFLANGSVLAVALLLLTLTPIEIDAPIKAGQFAPLLSKLPELSPDVELVIYRIAQESLTNALRHSGARSATLSLGADAETLTLRVADDGRGMPVDLPSGTAGMAGMLARRARDLEVVAEAAWRS